MMLFSGNISAQFFFAEDFSGYTTGSNVENAINPNNPDVGEWVSVQESAGNIQAVIVDEQLTYTDYVYSGRGKAMRFNPSTTGTYNTVLCLSRNHLPYPCQPEGNFIDGSNEFYTAFMLDMNEAAFADVQEIFSHYQLSTGTKRGRIFCKLSTDKKSVAFSLLKKEDSPASWTSYFDKTKTILLVVKYSHVCINEKNLGHAEFELFINPNPNKTEDENNSSKISATDNASGYDTDLRYVNFRHSGQTSMKVAGIRIANSFEQVLKDSGDTGITDFSETDIMLYVKRNTLFLNKHTNGKLFIYDVNAQLLRSYNIQGQKSIKTDLKPGAYVVLYNESENKKHVQKILIN